MKAIAIVCAFVIALSAVAQQNMRKQGSELLRNVYMRQAVQDGCRDAQEVAEQLDGPGTEFVVNCAARKEWLGIMAELYRLAAGCDESNAPQVTVRVLGSALPINCTERAADLPLIEEWLR